MRSHLDSDQRSDQIEGAWTAHRPCLVDLAFRMLGDIGAAEDVVQEAFSRLWQARIEDIEDQRGWLIVVTSRLCLDQIRSAHARRSRAEDSAVIDRSGPGPGAVDPADRVTLDDGVRLALVVVLEHLTPAERVVFVLHDVFQHPFDVVADTVGRTPASCRQLARRARQKVEAAHADAAQPSPGQAARHQMIAERFISACSSGRLDDLISVLDPGVSGTVDIRDVVVTGAGRVARNLLRYWGGPDVTLVWQPVGGRPALLAFADRALRGILILTIEGDHVSEIHVVADAAKLDFVQSQLAR